MNVEALEQLILEHQDKLGETSDKRPYRAMLYTIPVFNNPTTVSLSPGQSYLLL
jgi:DNA-binding transcriptional MocR family regulator